MKRFLLTVSSFAGFLFCNGQQVGRMETDRPDQTESVFITKKNYLQAEFGFNLERDGGLKNFVHPTALWKYGASKRFELRMITEFVSVETPLVIPAGNKILSGLLPVQFGGKVALWEEKGFLPKTAILFHVAPAKFGSKKFHTEKWTPGFRFSMQHSLSETIGLGYNLGAEWDGESKTPYWVYTLAPGINIGKNWYGYIEVFGAVRKNEMPQHNIDGGFGYYINDNIKLDISSGVGISEAATDWYSAIGFSFRFNTKK